MRRIHHALVCIAMAACASIVHRSRGFDTPPQRVLVTSEPRGAVVRLDGVLAGITPATVMVRRKGPAQTLSISLEGFVTAAFPLRRELSGAAYGNLGFLALPFHPTWGTG